MGKRPVLESKLRKMMRDPERFQDGAVSFVEWARGGDAGMPDTFIHKGDRLVPLELKRGESVVKELRPAQRLWHRTALTMGTPTYGATIVEDDAWSGGFRILIYSIELRWGRTLVEVLLETISYDAFCLDTLRSALR